jgi:acetyltransferase-like isoleucine patch superfamily enzyme
VLSLRNLRWVLRHRAWSPYHLRRYLRFAVLRLRHPHVITEGFVFLGRDVELYARKGYGRLVLGALCHVGDGSRLRAHEGTLRIGSKAVLAGRVRVNCYLDVSIGSKALVADDVYITDFDHRFADLTLPIKDQGIVKAPVRIGADSWMGTKATVLRGVDVGDGSVIAANSAVTRDIPPYSVAAGVPARVVRSRLPEAPA